MFKRNKSNKLPSKPIDYPIGTFIETEKGYFYIAAPLKRYHLISKRTLDSWNPPRVVKTTEAAVSRYRVAAKMRFRNGSLIHSLIDGKVYLIENSLRRPLVSPEAFERIGSHVRDKSIVTVSAEELRLHQLGEELS